MIESLDESLARMASIKKVVAEEACELCWATQGLHELTCPKVKETKRKPKKEKAK